MLMVEVGTMAPKLELSDKPIQIRVQRQTRQELEAEAAEKGLSLSALIRMILLEHVRSRGQARPSMDS